MVSNYNLEGIPGGSWAYNDYAINLYAKVLFQRVWQASPQLVFDEVFRSLQFQHTPTVAEDPRYGRISISTDDFARVGLLVACRGKWKDLQVIPEAFFDNIKNQVPESLPKSAGDCRDDPCRSGSFGGECNQDEYWLDGRGRYGYNFWVFNEEHSYGVPIPPDTIILEGKKGESMMIVIPSLDVIAVGLGSPGWGDPREDSNLGFRSVIGLITAAVGQVAQAQQKARR
jgi:CubicO group peptidase (beta-lactamase class C family)